MSIPVRLLSRRALLLAAAAVLLPFSTAQSQQGATPEISPAEARARASTGEMTLIDVRTPEEWRETGIAPGATPINMYHPGGAEGFTKDVLARVGGKRDAPIAVICRSGNRSSQVQRLLAAQGFTRVYNVSEGMSGSAAGPGWVKRGLPVETCKTC
ncbi:rhodanese-like domain-containing protein [Aromatoleum diolicum]|uniref:Rhodanese-like domain-containing protein n=1 Tax=Aromatoleum diolicum TaxID=75796 RepID=A0ABX1Q9K8_9RHOO|nr:rhodanese-like domain-containing protein [Aromatoleum diolicum]NMG73810.1 rhodanese-like domain-containing protein [Aromatoleum diolicum]